MSDLERAAAKRDQAARAARNLLVESLGEARAGTAILLVAVVACVLVPSILFVTLGPGNMMIELAVAVIFAVLALVLAIRVPAAVQDRLAARRLAGLGRLAGFDVAHYRELLSRPRRTGRLVVNVRLPAEPPPDARAQLARALVGWQLEWDGATLLAETPELAGTLALEAWFKSPGAPAAAFTNAAFHARLAALIDAVEAIAAPSAIAVDIAGEALPWDAEP